MVGDGGQRGTGGVVFGVKAIDGAVFGQSTTISEL